MNLNIVVSINDLDKYGNCSFNDEVIFINTHAGIEAVFNEDRSVSIKNQLKSSLVYEIKDLLRKQYFIKYIEDQLKKIIQGAIPFYQKTEVIYNENISR